MTFVWTATLHDVPKQVDHEQRRTEIITATWQALEELGLEGTTMREIATRAGCTTGRLNHYFDNRDAIIVAALRRVHTDAAQRMLDTISGLVGREALRHVLLQSLPLDRRRQTEWAVWLAFWSKAVVDEHLRGENAQRYREWRDLIGQLLASTTAQRANEREQSLDLILSTIDGLGLQATLEPSRMNARRMERAVDRLLSLTTGSDNLDQQPRAKPQRSKHAPTAGSHGGR